MPKELDEVLTRDGNGRFVDCPWLFGQFGSFKYTPTNEKVVLGFRRLPSRSLLGLALNQYRENLRRTAGKPT